MRAETSRDMLCGLLALQTGLIDQTALVAAFHAWTLAKGRPMADILVEHGALDAQARQLIEALTAKHLELHGGDCDQSLAAVSAGRSTRESLARICDPDIEATLAHVGLASSRDDDDSDRTPSFSVGSVTTDGQRFRVIRPHAKGGLGAVFVARDGELNREVALKQILDQHADDPTSRARFLNEAEITGGLEHPGIVPVYGLGTYAGGRPFYAMRFIRGDSLKEAIAGFHGDETAKGDRSARSLALRKLLRRFTDVCNAIDYAHGRGVLHRDLKPGNIIVGKHGETLVVDWGLAKATGLADPAQAERALVPASASGSAETLPGSALGTPAYMSPEQAAGDLDRIGPGSDVYSLGATLYCLLTGKPPFDGDDIGQLLRAVQKGDFAPPRKIDATIDRTLEAICKKAMATTTDDRYPSPRALAEDIDRWMADEPVSAYPERLAERLARWMRRHRGLTQAAGAALAAAAIVAIVAAVLIDRSRTETRAQRDRAQANFLRAEENFQLAKNAVEDYLTRVSEDTLLKAQDRQDLRELRKRLLEDALKYYEQFIRQRSDHVKQQADLAHAYSRVGMITEEIGSKDQALVARKKALELFSKLSREQPGDTENRHALASELSQIGSIQRDKGASEEAKASVARALQLFQQLTRDNAQLPAYRHGLARAHNLIAIIQTETGAPKAALESYRQALAIMEVVARENPSNIKFRSLLATIVNNIGLVLESLDDGRGAIDSYRRAVGIFEALAREDPSEPRWRNMLAAAHNDIGALRGRLDGPVSGMPDLRRAVEIHLAVTRAHPSVSAFQDDLARTYMNVAHLEGKNGDRPAALISMRLCLDVRASLAQGNPGVFWFQNQLGSTHMNIGSMQFELGEFADAVRSFEQALAIEEPLVRKNPDKPVLAKTLGMAAYRLGLTREAQQRPALAVEAMATAIAHHRVAFERAPEFPDYRHYLSDDYHALARFERALNRDREAAEAARACLALWPDNPDELYDVAGELACCASSARSRRGPDGTGSTPKTDDRAFADEAIAVIRKAISAGFVDAKRLIRDPRFHALRPRGDFAEIVARLLDRSFPSEPIAR
jgi:eukaryotic-like serine/threonine-protein kinase